MLDKCDRSMTGIVQREIYIYIHIHIYMKMEGKPVDGTPSAARSGQAEERDWVRRLNAAWSPVNPARYEYLHAGVQVN